MTEVLQERNLARLSTAQLYRRRLKELEAGAEFFQPQHFLVPKEPAMNTGCTYQDSFEISPRFRRTVEERIARLERDAAYDEAQIAALDDIDHVRRQMRLVAAERAEALRMRLFLDRAKTRLPKPMISI